MPAGDFSKEAYEQLREAYSKESKDQRSSEERGFDIMGLNLGLETAPIDSPWADKIDLWKYPDGKSEYIDKNQDPAEILQIMRDSAQAKLDAKEEAKAELEEEDDEEVEVDEEVETEEESEETEESEEEEEEDEEESEDEDEEEAEEEEDSETEEEESDLDAEEIAGQIADLRAELEQMQFVSTSTDDES